MRLLTATLLSALLWGLAPGGLEAGQARVDFQGLRQNMRLVSPTNHPDVSTLELPPAP